MNRRLPPGTLLAVQEDRGIFYNWAYNSCGDQLFIIKKNTFVMIVSDHQSVSRLFLTLVLCQGKSVV